MASTIKHASGVILSTLGAAITRSEVEGGLTDFLKLGGGRLWVFDARAVTQPPTPEILDRLASVLADAARLGNLKKAVVVSAEPAVRLGAQMLSLKARVYCAATTSLDDALKTV